MENTISDVEKARLPTADEKIAITALGTGTTTTVTAAQKVFLDQLVAGTYKTVLAAERTTLTNAKTILDGYIGTPIYTAVPVANATTLNSSKTILDSLIGTPTAAVVSVAEHTTLTSCKTILDSLIGTPTASVVPVANASTLNSCKTILDSLIGSPTNAIPSVAEATALTRIAAMPLYCYLAAPALAVANLIISGSDWATGTLSALTTLDMPRNLTAVLTDINNSCAGTLTITGLDNQDRVVTETLVVTAAPGGKTLTGTKIFKTITSIAISNASGGTPSTDVLSIGSGTVIGLPFDITAAGSVKVTYFNGAVVTPTITTGVSTSGLDASASTYNGTKVLYSLVKAA